MGLQRPFALLAYGALASAIFLALVAPGAVQVALFWPLLASLLIFGLPHGAVDHNVPARLGAPSVRNPLLIGYVALTAAGLVLWWIAPAVALAIFLAAAAVHWETARSGGRRAASRIGSKNSSGNVRAPRASTGLLDAAPTTGVRRSSVTVRAIPPPPAMRATWVERSPK